MKNQILNHMRFIRYRYLLQCPSANFATAYMTNDKEYPITNLLCLDNEKDLEDLAGFYCGPTITGAYRVSNPEGRDPTKTSPYEKTKLEDILHFTSMILDIDPLKSYDNNRYKEDEIGLIEYCNSRKAELHALIKEQLAKYNLVFGENYIAMNGNGLQYEIFLDLGISHTKLFKSYFRGLCNVLKVAIENAKLPFEVDESLEDYSKLAGLNGTPIRKKGRKEVFRSLYECEFPDPILLTPLTFFDLNAAKFQSEEVKTKSGFVVEEATEVMPLYDTSAFDSETGYLDAFNAALAELVDVNDFDSVRKFLETNGIRTKGRKDDSKGWGVLCDSPFSVNYTSRNNLTSFIVYSGLRTGRKHNHDVSGFVNASGYEFVKKALPDVFSKLSDKAKIACSQSVIEYGPLAGPTLRLEDIIGPTTEDNNEQPSEIDPTVFQVLNRRAIAIDDNWFDPKVRQLRNLFFADYEQENGVLKLEDKRIMMVGFGIMAKLKAALGKRCYTEKTSTGSKTYVGSSCSIILDQSGAGKTDIYNYLTVLTSQYRSFYELSMNLTFHYFLDQALQLYSPKEIPKTGKAKKPVHKPELACEADCRANLNGLFVSADEGSEALKQLVGGWSADSSLNRNLFLLSLDDAPTYSGRTELRTGSKANGAGFLYDHCISYFCSTTVDAFIKKVDPLSEDNKNAGLLARLGMVVEGLPSNLDLSTKSGPDNRQDILQEFTDYLDNRKTAKLVLDPADKTSLESLDFGKDNDAVKSFIASDPDMIQSVRNKLHRAAITDCMLRCVLNNTTKLSTYYNDCLKLRFGMFINSYIRLSSMQKSPLDSQILEKFQGLEYISLSALVRRCTPDRTVNGSNECKQAISSLCEKGLLEMVKRKNGFVIRRKTS